jgi:hypothetical protein
VLAITARRSCALCSASDIPLAVPLGVIAEPSAVISILPATFERLCALLAPYGTNVAAGQGLHFGQAEAVARLYGNPLK